MQSKNSETDFRAAPLEAFCRVHPAKIKEKADAIVTPTENNYILVRDPRVPEELTKGDAIRRYKVGKALPPNSSQGETYQEVGKSALEWFWEGYSATIVTFGQTQTGKSYSLYSGKLIGGHVEEMGLCYRILNDIYTQLIPNSEDPSQYLIGLSCWDVHRNETIDLLSSEEPRSGHVQPLVVVHAPTLDACNQILLSAHSKSNNWKVSQRKPGELDHEPNVSHSFVRIALYNGSAKRLSTLHIVDLIGAQSFNPKDLYQPSDKEKEAHRKAVNQQLLAFSRVVTELARLDPNDKGSNRLISARESKLTQYLGPLLAKNSKTYLLATVSPLSENYLDTVNTLRIVTRALSINTMCTRILNVELDEIHWKPWESSEYKAVSPSRRAESTSAFLNELEPMNADKDTRSRRAEDTDSDNEDNEYERGTGKLSHSEYANMLKQELGSKQPNSNESKLESDEEQSGDSAENLKYIDDLDTESNFGASTTMNTSIRSKLKSEINSVMKDLEDMEDAELRPRPPPPKQYQPLDSLNSKPDFEEPDPMPDFRVSDMDDDPRSSNITQIEKELDAIQKRMAQSSLRSSIPTSSPASYKPASSLGKSGRTPTKVRFSMDKNTSIPIPSEPEISPIKSHTSYDFESGVEPTEAEVFKKNYESVLSVLQNEEKVKVAQMGRLKELEEELLEKISVYELKIEEQRSENIKLKSRLRKLEQESVYGEIFESYEREQHRLADEVARLLGENVELQERVETLEKYRGKIDIDENQRQDAIHTLKKTIRDARNEIKELKVANNTLKRHERLSVIQQKALEESQRKSSKLTKEGTHKDSEYQKLQSSYTVLRNKMDEMEIENETLKEFLEKFQLEIETEKDDLKELTQQFFKLKDKYLGSKRLQTAEKIPQPLRKKKSKEKEQSMSQHIVQRLMEELGVIGPKYTTLLAKLKKEIEKMEQDKDDSKARETQLLNLIVEYNQKDDPYCQHLLHYQDLIYKKAEKLAQLERMSKGIFT